MRVVEIRISVPGFGPILAELQLPEPGNRGTLVLTLEARDVGHRGISRRDPHWPGVVLPLEALEPAAEALAVAVAVAREKSQPKMDGDGL
jgi:hypothetical protein